MCVCVIRSGCVKPISFTYHCTILVVAHLDLFKGLCISVLCALARSLAVINQLIVPRIAISIVSIAARWFTCKPPINHEISHGTEHLLCYRLSL
jgi:hypothetical protein